MFNERHQQCSLLSQKPDIYVHHTQNYIVIVKIENKIVQSKILNRKDKIIKARHLHTKNIFYLSILHLFCKIYLLGRKCKLGRTK